MLTGLTLILLGILVYLHPKIVVGLFAGILIAGGLVVVGISWRVRRLYREAQPAGNIWTRFIARF